MASSKTVYEVIKADHNKHRDLLKKVDANDESSKKYWEKFFYDVKAHAAAEEETFYSKLMAQTWGQDAARHSVQEHAEMDTLLEELFEMDYNTEDWRKKFKKLHHDYIHHIDEEEEEIFERAHQVIKENEEKELGSAFLNRKKKELKLVDQKREDHMSDSE